MKLLLLGTGGYFPNGRRQTACLLLPEVGVVLDAGSGMFRLREHLATDRLDIFLSHAHLDHIVGLTYLVNILPADVLKRTTVHGDATKLDAIRTHLFNEQIFPVAPTVQFASLTAGACPLPAGGTLTHFPLVHPGGSVGFRLDWPGHSLAYVTDTTAAADAEYASHLRGVDLLVHEAYFNDDRENYPARTGHSSLPHVAEIAARAKVGRLVLTHINPFFDSDAGLDVNAAQKTFAHIEIGADGATIEF